MNDIKFELAKVNDITIILEIIKERCDWFLKSNIEQWGSWYYEDLYDYKYFLEAMKKNNLYVVKNNEEIVGLFLLKYENDEYWKDFQPAIYLDHFVTKLGHQGLGEKILDFIRNKAHEKNLKYLRLDCMRCNPKINEYYQKHGFQNKGEGNEPYEYRLWEMEL